MPYFSVVIPTFNCAVELAETVKSVLNQTCDDFEILVMDDGSSDSTRDVVASLRNSRIRYYWNPNSGGPATPRNLGMDLSEGEWICFLDADDIWYPTKLECVRREINRLRNVDVVCHWEMLRVSGKKKMKMLKHGPYEKDFYRRLLIDGNRVSTSATCVRKDFVRAKNLRFNQSPDYVIVEDYDFWMNLAREGAQFLFIEKALGEYVLEGGNISANKDKYFCNLETMLKNQVYRVQPFANPEILWKTIKAQIDLSKVRCHFETGELGEGLLLAMRVVLRDPGVVVRKLIRLVNSTIPILR